MYIYFVIYIYIPFFLGNTRIFLSDPDMIKHVAVTNSKNYDRAQYVKTFIPSTGDGLFSAIGKDHAHQRKMVNPAFNYNNLMGMVDDFKDVTNNLVKVNIKYNITVKVYIFTYLYVVFLHLMTCCN